MLLTAFLKYILLASRLYPVQRLSRGPNLIASFKTLLANLGRGIERRDPADGICFRAAPGQHVGDPYAVIKDSVELSCTENTTS